MIFKLKKLSSISGKICENIKQMSQKILTGILGGTFDPVHKAHTELAAAAYARAHLDEIFFAPAHIAPLRDAPPQASDSQRLAMLKIAIDKLPFPRQIELFEMERENVGYSIDTARHLIKKYPNRKFYWIIGADHIAKLKQWKDISELCKLVEFVCAARSSCDINPSDIPVGAKIKFIDFDDMPHSSTLIRESLQKGTRQNFMLDEGVLKYILKYKLYDIANGRKIKNEKDGKENDSKKSGG